MRAKYCKCKNTYSIKGCKSKKCKAPYYWSQGIGSIHINNHVSTIVNEDTERVETHTASVKTSQEGNVTNVDTTRIINN
jgi:hypothetical protein